MKWSNECSLFTFMLMQPNIIYFLDKYTISDNKLGFMRWVKSS